MVQRHGGITPEMIAHARWMTDQALKNRLSFICSEAEEKFHVASRGRQRLAKRVADLMMKEFGFALPDPRHGLADYVEYSMEPGAKKAVLAAAGAILRETRDGTSGEFVDTINRIVSDAGLPDRLADDLSWVTSAETEADEILRQVIADRSDVAGCQRGDVQVEMVASSAQAHLGPGTVIVDYGAGLGRVGDGLSTASEFVFSRYIAVDDPVDAELSKLVSTFGANGSTMGREAFLKSPEPADVILMVNTLHHVPFADIPRQIGTLVRSMKPGGILVLHEMGEIDPPEQKNVPWNARRIASLLEGEGLKVSPRETTSKGKKVPLAHVIVGVTGSLSRIESRLAERACAVWDDMKTATLRTISTIYAEKNPDRLPNLRRAMIHNANLDLNLPPQSR